MDQIGSQMSSSCDGGKIDSDIFYRQGSGAAAGSSFIKETDQKN